MSTRDVDARASARERVLAPASRRGVSWGRADLRRDDTVKDVLPETSARPWVVVAADVPLAPPTHGNRVRNVQLVAALRAAGFRVHYLYWERNTREGDVAGMRALVDELEVVSSRPSRFARRWTRLRRGVACALNRPGLLPELAWWSFVEERNHESLCPSALVAALERVLDEGGDSGRADASNDTRDHAHTGPRVDPRKDPRSATRDDPRKDTRSATGDDPCMGTRRDTHDDAHTHVSTNRSIAGVVVSYANLWPLARAARARGVLSVIDSHDVMHERGATLREQGIKPTGLLVRRDVEARWLSEADLVLAIQPREALVLSELVGVERVRCIGHGVELPSPPPASPVSSMSADSSVSPFSPVPSVSSASQSSTAAHRLTMLGSNNRPNQHGLEWFVSEVWPIVTRDVPDAELCVFGPLSRTSACTGPRVTPMGEVADVRTAYECARVALNPVRAGSGLKIKSVDALAWGRALVTTSIGAEGLEAGAGDAFLVGDTPAAFAAHVVTLLRDQRAADALGARAQAFASAHFAPAAVYAPLVTALRARVVAAP